ncbi:signal peptide protein [Bifidobacterium anseris]|uniref:Signal peptide protein n=2 Tax=Bifidobacterium TaxID=1678 RepID=A0A2N5IZH9_9BIFI|nr:MULTISPECIES: FHA domain-containing protein [Bifidobacterium]PLS27363.1 signal peptide protein [Bifidobacterium anseris]
MSIAIGTSAGQRQEKTYAVASCGKQIASNCIDLAVLVIVAGGTQLLGHDLVLTIIVAVELVLTMMIWEGVRGETIGRLITGTRTVREECVTSRNGGVLPAGMLLIMRKYGMLLVCTCAAGVGLLVEMCSSAFASKSAIRRDWADGVASLVQVDIDRPLLLGISTVGAPIGSSLDFRYTSTNASMSDTTGAPDAPSVPAVREPSPLHTEAAPVVAPVVPVPAAAMSEELVAPTASTPTPAPAESAAVESAPAAPVAPASPTAQARPQRSSSAPRHSKRRPAPALPTRPPATPVRPPALPERPPQPAAGVHVALPQRPAQEATREQTLIMYLEGGKRVNLPKRGAIVVGRKPVAVEDGDGVVTLKDTTGTVSRSHARIEINDGEIWVTDLGSLNGTTVAIDGEEHRLQRDVREQIEPGARLSFGDMTGSIMRTTRRRNA